MAKEIIGYRRLYQALGCFPTGIAGFHGQYDLREDLKAEIYIADTRPVDQMQVSEKFYMYPSERTSNEQSFTSPITSLGPPSSPDRPPLVTELLIWRRILVSDELSQGLVANDRAAVEKLVAIAHEYEHELCEALDLVVGTLALRYHRQFIARLINEGVVAAVGQSTEYSFITGRRELLDPVDLTSQIRSRMAEGLSKIGPARNGSWKQDSAILRWLIRAWDSQDRITEFVSLFIPIEIMLEGQKVERSKEAKDLGRAIRKLIDKSPKQGRAQLITFYTNLLQRFGERPSLEERFQAYATEAKLPGWQDDIDAFGHYNKIRNKIIHKGETNIPNALISIQQGLPRLTELAEKYIGYALFGDTDLYVSRIRRLEAESAALATRNDAAVLID